MNKSSFAEHVKSSKTHADAVNKLNSKWKASKRTGTEVVTLPSSGQIDICTSIANASHDQIAQLTLKLQLVHFAVSKSKPFKLYANFGEFECGVHNVRKREWLLEHFFMYWNNIVS